ncbi:MAG: hypothetical protein Q7R81_06555 [Candidatus Peregrinibacteria bacterium]|nr:hypothetical protein [Candidatus Peregrinibacteria bacterium]
MNPKSFLQIGGVVLLALGILGYLVPEIGTLLSFSPYENIAHLVLGIVALVLAPLPLGDLKKWVVVLVGLVALYFGVAGFMVAGDPPLNYYGLVQLDNPVDNVIHLVVGLWALASAFTNKRVVTA